jgi:hypothetical protein
VGENRHTKINFKTWLLRQCKRNDPVGDLARDAKETQFPHGCTSWIKIYLFILKEYHPCDGAIKALHRARKEYEDSLS